MDVISACRPMRQQIDDVPDRRARASSYEFVSAPRQRAEDGICARDDRR